MSHFLDACALCMHARIHQSAHPALVETVFVLVVPVASVRLDMSRSLEVHV
jgi:hypothetical protein